MNEHDFSGLLQQLPELSPSQHQRLHRYLKAHDITAFDLLATQAAPGHCPYCHTDHFKPWGSSHGLPRYRCTECSRTFNALTGTPLAKLHKREHWVAYLNTLIEGLSLRAAAQQCGINKDTALLWRHRFLHMISQHQATHEHGIVEADETFFLESFKGQRQLDRPSRKRGGVGKTRGTGADQVPVLIVRDRHKATANFILTRVDAVTIRQALQPLIDKEAMLCTDGAAVYSAFAKNTGIAHEVIHTKGPRARGVFHVQNVNAYGSRLKTWMRRFHGVATKYLGHYLGWRLLLERYQSVITPELCLLEAVGRVPQQLSWT